MSAEIAWRVLAETDLPFATISRDGISADSDSFTPGASFFASPAPETPTDVDRLDRLAENDLDQIRAILRDFRDVAPAKRLVVSDCPAMLQTAAFLFEHVRLTPVPVRMQTLVVDASDRVFTIRMYDATDKCPADQFDYGPMISSLLIR